MRVTVVACLFIITFASFAQSIGWGVDESKHVPVGLKAGDLAPNFNVPDYQGNEVMLSELLKSGEVVLLFYRGQWCPVCNRYLSNFQDSVNAILERGASVVAITPETAVNAGKMVGKTKMTFTVVPDREGSIMKDYDVLFYVTNDYQDKIKGALLTDIAKNNGANEAFLPVPATYIISQNGIIKKVFFDYNYKNRASVGEILETLD